MTRALATTIAVLLVGAGAFFALAPLRDMKADISAQRVIVDEQRDLLRDQKSLVAEQLKVLHSQRRLIAGTVAIQRRALGVSRSILDNTEKGLDHTRELVDRSITLQGLVQTILARIEELLGVTYDVRHHVREINRKTPESGKALP